MVEEHFDTQRLHAGYDWSKHQYASSVPIYATAAFGLENFDNGLKVVSGQKKEFSYSRVSNPTTEVFENRIAALEGGVGAVALGSGMAAITYTIFNVAEGGGHVLAPSNIYGGSLDEFRTLFPKFGITVDFYDDVNDLTSIQNQITADTKAIYAESVANPSTEITDVAGLADIAHTAGIPLIIDNTFPTPYLFKPFEFGADISIYSSTKGINGHGNVIGGLVVDNGKFDWSSDKFPQLNESEFILTDDAHPNGQSFVEKFGSKAFISRIRMKYLRLMGAVLSPVEAYMSLIGLETISERVTKEVASATKIAKYLQENSHVKRVYYSGLDTENSLVKKYYPHGIGAILAFEVAGGIAQIRDIINGVQIFSYLPNVGDAKSLIVNPTKTTHREIPEEIRAKHALNDNVIRLSIGLEDVDDLIADLDQAISGAFND
ncbi:O-acetylhomoserine aminocarboxypropyltransferase [Secundilactobacillus paracollinoides]|uniref:homocysteine desulfhydrase n=1 Tax=Secundilactobacillus paracollinoides TaxID=240427 RepID=A0A1B2IY21_9LACO|nr:PLP-dependent transferase [Secundilactobacillus paracollinoides]ANZ61052.1 O-acetylhomoserine aminocarboxypropyltransferase [Secundilactobacillus paracollinoides]ANZ64526.1 O-acetylhomoserine aminocarboxypropyltransferase [Secundilactobacillus paracollinoides]ANZ66974.1 O-acetylhomoserine aminocarboxypropyltransferase [Secundilactobacillus paracollinoides]KRL77029.1 Cysteine synthase [Secundilactobacillus paracollinoides DSM 15502 = JCM 11969]